MKPEHGRNKCIAALLSLIFCHTVWPASPDAAAVGNSSGGAEVAFAESNYIAHAWEAAPGFKSNQGWVHYQPGGHDVVMAHDINGRIMIAWIAGGHIMLATEPYARSSLSAPVVLVTDPKVKELRVASSPTGRLVLAALTDSGSIITDRQTRPDAWEWQGPVDLNAQKLRNVSVTSLQDGRFAIAAAGGDRRVYVIVESQPSTAQGWGAWTTVGGSNLESAEVQQAHNDLLEIVAVDKDHLLQHTEATAAGAADGWQSLSPLQVGDSVRLAREPDGTLVAWGANGNTFSLGTGVNSAWTPGGPLAPIAWAVMQNQTFLSAFIATGSYPETTVTQVPAHYEPNPQCIISPTTGQLVQFSNPDFPCSPPEIWVPAGTVTQTKNVKYYDVNVTRNANPPSTLEDSKP
jgi:hypothetical protein